jgi:N-carbamoyl-L-amino-acid hydrolase
LPAVATGSHIDAIPNAGRRRHSQCSWPEALRARAQASDPAIDLVIIFTAEEPTRFGIGCLGSRLLSGALDESAGARLTDTDGRSLDEVRQTAGCVGQLSSVRLRPGAYSAFVELHIEQGPLLERRGVEIGLVTAIAAPAGLKIGIEGGRPAARPDARSPRCLSGGGRIARCRSRARRRIGRPLAPSACATFPGAVNNVPVVRASRWM